MAEVLDHLVRRCRAEEDVATLDVAQLGLREAGPTETATAVRAVVLRAHHYHRQHRPVSLADCFVAATAELICARVATSDAPLLTLCQHEDIGVVVLPDSTGRLWSPDAGTVPA